MFATFGRLCLKGMPLMLLFVPSDDGVFAQGMITFDARNNWIGTDYTESGMAFRLIIPQGASRDYMGITYGADNTPRNGTPFMGWFRQFNPYNYVSLSLTDGSLFGLTSVDLADPISPSLSPVTISFIGYLTGGTTVTNTFTTPGNGATTFANYQFNPDFTTPLFTHVDILAPRWAMDNLVFVIPEPGAAGLFLFGLLAGIANRRQRSGLAAQPETGTAPDK